MAKGIRDYTEEELQAFFNRMIDSVEELDAAGSTDEWLDFVGTKIFGATGTYTDRQAELAELIRIEGQVQMYGELGVGRETPFKTRPTQIRYRDTETGRFVSRSVLNEGIVGMKRK